MSTISQSTTTPAAAENVNASVSHLGQANQLTASITTTTSDNQAVSLEATQNTPVTLSRIQAADIELELNELPSLNQQDLPLSEVLAVSLNEVLQDEDTAMDAAGNE